MVRATFLAALLLSSCGTVEGVSEVYERRFVGGPVSAAVAALGPPALRRPRGGDSGIGSGPGEILTWEFARARDHRVPVYERRAGLLLVTGYRTEATVLECLYEIETDASGTVVAQRLEGSPEFCLDRLQR